MHRAIFFFAALVAALSLSSAQDQDLEELEGTPFMIGGNPYRDMLTIGASRAVAQFASRYQPRQKQRVGKIGFSVGCIRYDHELS